MNQKGFSNTLIIILALVVIGGIASYFVFNKTFNNPPCQSSDYCKDSSFVPSGHGRVPGCVNVLFAGGTRREQVKSLLQQLKLKEPAALSEDAKPFGAFVPTLEVIVHDFEQTAALLKKDSNVVDVQLLYRSLNPESADYGDYHIYVLFIDSMTPSRARRLLSDTYKLQANPGIPDGVPLRLEVPPWSVNSTVRALWSSSIVQFVLQCPVQGPARAN
ncbi:MAG: hypothetical protein Q7S01_05185 [bacterium]|nr:hypothetical protein [bacterium]